MNKYTKVYLDLILLLHLIDITLIVVLSRISLENLVTYSCLILIFNKNLFIIGLIYFAIYDRNKYHHNTLLVLTIIFIHVCSLLNIMIKTISTISLNTQSFEVKLYAVAMNG